MNEQEKFMEMIEDVVKLAKVNGRETSVEFLDEFFSELDLAKEQMRLVYDYLLSANIKVKGYKGKKFTSEKNEAHVQKKDEGESEYLHLYLKELQAADRNDQLDMELVSQMLEGDKSAHTKLTEYFLPFVVEEAKKLKNNGLSQSDLIQEGNLGLLMGLAVITKEHSRQQVFDNVMEAVREAMYQALDELQEHHRSSSAIVRKANYIKEKAEELAEDMKDKISVQDMADYMEMNIEEIQDILRITGDGDAMT